MDKIILEKKNRKYFAATKAGYKCKVLIDEMSENLELGEHELALEDMSVRSKYGTDLIFKVKGDPLKEMQELGVCTLRHDRYNRDLVKRCHELNGKWDGTEQAWVFSASVDDLVQELDDKYNTDVQMYDIELDVSGHAEPYYLCGYKIAEAWGRDSGAKLADGVILLSGKVRSGGSMKNWTTRVEGTIRIPLSKYFREKLDAKLSE